MNPTENKMLEDFAASIPGVIGVLSGKLKAMAEGLPKDKMPDFAKALQNSGFEKAVGDLTNGANNFQDVINKLK